MVLDRPTMNSILSLADVICFLSPGFGQEAPPLSLLHTIPLPHVRGAFNHIPVDPGQQRLFAAASVGAKNSDSFRQSTHSIGYANEIRIHQLSYFLAQTSFGAGRDPVLKA